MSILHNQNEDEIGPSPFRYNALTAFAKPLGEWKTGNLSFEEFEAYQSILEKYPHVKTMDNDARYNFFVDRRHEIQMEMAKLDRQEAELKLDILTKKQKVVKELVKWSESLKIECPDGISFRKMRKAFAEDRTLYLDKSLYGTTPKLDFEKEIFRFAEILLIEHDWASAFKDADLPSAVVKLPYDVCAFEFKFSGRPVIVLATQFGTEIAFTPIVLVGDLWVVTDCADYLGSTRTDGMLYLIQECGRQIRAACISLDAQVAKAEMVREPHLGAHGKNAHQPLKGYHVVSLAHRGPRPLASVGTETDRRIRLHFRRGHWRHFEAHKTWINWQLCGNPELGFIDKHYRL